jgi:predicted GNAT family acetyltransferase
MFEKPGATTEPRERPQIGHLDHFDSDYFKQLEGPDGWMAIGQENCRNQRYFTVMSTTGEKLGIVGMYDTDEDKNISHTVVDPKYRGMGLAKDFKEKLLDQTGEQFYIATVNLNNASSLAAMQKISDAKAISTPEYEREFNKRKFRYDRPETKK